MQNNKYYVLAHITEKRETVDEIIKFIESVDTVSVKSIHMINDCNYEILIESEIHDFYRIVRDLSQVVSTTHTCEQYRFGTDGGCRCGGSCEPQASLI